MSRSDKTKDPHTLGCVGYSHAPDLAAGDERLPKFEKQREEFGFDDSEMWNLDITIAQFLAPRLRRYAEVCPFLLEPDDFREEGILRLAELLELVTEHHFMGGASEEDIQRLRAAMHEFADNLTDLWT